MFGASPNHVQSAAITDLRNKHRNCDILRILGEMALLAPRAPDATVLMDSALVTLVLDNALSNATQGGEA